MRIILFLALDSMALARKPTESRMALADTERVEAQPDLVDVHSGDRWQAVINPLFPFLKRGLRGILAEGEKANS